MATLTLVYNVATGEGGVKISPNRLLTKMTALTLDEGEIAKLGYTLSSDTSAIVGTDVERTVVLTTNATTDEQFPDQATQEASVKGLFKQKIFLRLPGPVNETLSYAP